MENINKCLTCGVAIQGRKKFCSFDCYNKNRIGVARNIKTREKISESQLGQHHSTITEFKKGHRHSQAVIEKIRKARLERYTGFIMNDKDIINEIERLSKEGYRCIPTGLQKFPRPDIIAIKDNQVKAIEINRGRTSRKDKYDNWEYFDEIVWIRKPPVCL